MSVRRRKVPSLKSVYLELPDWLIAKLNAYSVDRELALVRVVRSSLGFFLRIAPKLDNGTYVLTDVRDEKVDIMFLDRELRSTRVNVTLSANLRKAITAYCKQVRRKRAMVARTAVAFFLDVAPKLESGTYLLMNERGNQVEFVFE